MKVNQGNINLLEIETSKQNQQDNGGSNFKLIIEDLQPNYKDLNQSQDVERMNFINTQSVDNIQPQKNSIVQYTEQAKLNNQVTLHKRNLSQQQQNLVNSSLKVNQGFNLNTIKDTDSQTERIEFLAGQTDMQESSFYQLSHRPFHINKSLLIDEGNQSILQDVLGGTLPNGALKTQMDFYLNNMDSNEGRLTTLYQNDSQIHLRTMNIERNKLQIYDSNDVIYEDEASYLMNDRSSPENKHNQGIKHSNKTVFQRTQITDLNEQFTPKDINSKQEYGGGASHSQERTQMTSKITNGDLSVINQALTLANRRDVSVIGSLPNGGGISTRYQEITGEDQFSPFFVRDAKYKGLRVLQAQTNIIQRRKTQAFTMLKVHQIIEKIKIMQRMINNLSTFQYKQKFKAFFLLSKYVKPVTIPLKTSSLNYFSHTRQLSYKDSFNQQRSPKQSTLISLNQILPLNRLQTLISDNVSDVMEENIKENDLDVVDKNQKIQIIKKSQELSKKISQQSQYLESKKQMGHYNQNNSLNLSAQRRSAQYSQMKGGSQVRKSMLSFQIDQIIPLTERAEEQLEYNELKSIQEYFSRTSKNVLQETILNLEEVNNSQKQELSKTQSIATKLMFRILTRISNMKIKDCFNSLKEQPQKLNFLQENYDLIMSPNPENYKMSSQILTDFNITGNLTQSIIKSPTNMMNDSMMSPKESNHFRNQKRQMFRHQSPPIENSKHQKQLILGYQGSSLNKSQIQNPFQINSNNQASKVGSKTQQINHVKQKSIGVSEVTLNSLKKNIINHQKQKSALNSAVTVYDDQNQIYQQKAQIGLRKSSFNSSFGGSKETSQVQSLSGIDMKKSNQLKNEKISQIQFGVQSKMSIFKGDAPRVQNYKMQQEQKSFISSLSSSTNKTLEKQHQQNQTIAQSRLKMGSPLIVQISQNLLLNSKKDKKSQSSLSRDSIILKSQNMSSLPFQNINFSQKSEKQTNVQVVDKNSVSNDASPSMSKLIRRQNQMAFSENEIEQAITTTSNHLQQVLSLQQDTSNSNDQILDLNLNDKDSEEMIQHKLLTKPHINNQYNQPQQSQDKQNSNIQFRNQMSKLQSSNVNAKPRNSNLPRPNNNQSSSNSTNIKQSQINNKNEIIKNKQQQTLSSFGQIGNNFNKKQQTSSSSQR
eukprot:403359722